MMRLFKVGAVLLVLAALALGAVLYDAVTRPFRGFAAEGVYVEIPRGASTRRIGQRLQEHGVVRSAVAFEILARLRGRQQLKAGEYFFSQAATVDAVLERLARGDVYYVQLVIPEGLTMFQVADRVEAARLASREEFLKAARDASLLRDLAPQAQTLEGFLFPAKYEFPRRTSAAEIAQAMVAAFRREWRSLAGEAPAPAPNVLAVVTMASLVERETPDPAERAAIAGVYYNRLKKNIALQCDPTVLYAMDLAGRNDGVINQSDLRRDSPYNTYLYRGLPPGPIGNPGLAALRAALHPEPVEYLYFVANQQGGHHFSRTLTEHNRNVQRYRELERRQKPDSAGPPKSGNGKKRG